MELQGGSGRRRSKKKKMVDNNNRRPWSELPEALLHQITKWLGAIDYLLFACVCRTWRLYALANKQWFMASQPPFVVLFLTRGPKKFCYFYSIVDQRCFKALLPNLIGKELFGVSFGYLIIVDKKKISGSEIWLLNPFTRHELRFPSPPNQFQYVNLASLATPLPEYIIICFSHECVQFRRSTDVYWTLYKYDNPFRINSLALFNGKIYISNEDDIKVLNLNSHPHLTLLKVKSNPNLEPGWRKLLVFDKQLLVICGYSENEVYELNFLKMELVKIPNLGDQALFQDGSKFSAISNTRSWEAIGVPPSNNCIYRIYEHDCHYSVKFLDGRCPQTFPILRGERYIRGYKFWYFPHQSCRVDSLCED
ncbi:uncharacterized protein LOC112013148 [Quercus suber]|uniref:uncharacterized protein LOC112013148 n=1 Tax=Quercus suber TaxID=58331 RepID=UPI000CE2677F|nr:uncharacterized protein LOC112013148 [Quercus suber]POE49729.1 hypothetical protein CFP56_77825 [Quercus suber]